MHPMGPINRRSVLWGMGGFALAAGLAAYVPLALKARRRSVLQEIRPVVDPATLKKPDLTIGFCTCE